MGLPIKGPEVGGPLYNEVIVHLYTSISCFRYTNFSLHKEWIVSCIRCLINLVQEIPDWKSTEHPVLKSILKLAYTQLNEIC